MYRGVAIWWAIIVVALVVAHEDSEIEFINTKPGCNYTCVNSEVKIPYPFGIGQSCSYNSSYEIVCKHSNSSSGKFIPFLRVFDIQVFEIGFRFDDYGNNGSSKFDDKSLVIASESKKVCSVKNSSSFNKSLIGSPFSVSYDDNQIVVEGCSGHVNIRDGSDSIIGGCSSVCAVNGGVTNINDDACNGLGCCLINLPLIPLLLQYFKIELSELRKDFANTRGNSNICLNVTLMMHDAYGYSKRAVWNWYGPQISNPGKKFRCYYYYYYYGCQCSYGYKGNPYLPDGCQAIPNEDKNYAKNNAKKKAMVLGFSISLGTTILLIFCYGLFHVIRRWRQKKRKARFFKRNGGLLLQQQMTTRDNMVDRTKVFTDDELVKATDNYNSNRILGRGGQGTVYKGMLLDGRVIAIKKSLKVDESQIEHFINEVVILSQISHRNVVQLLGCCLETEVPLLVYEFIPNGTLSQHIQNPSEDFPFTWKMRLQIAVDSAGALAYLHSASATPIYHRDVKSSNILLDEKFRAKVADFGTSRTLTIDQTHLTTLVQGTLGYLDPEYFQTNQFTEKSDVYSFGVVLIELLTGQKPLTSEQSGGWKCLTVEFLSHMETSRLFDIIDPRLLDEAKQEELFILASLAMRCLNLNGKHRPTMKEVVSVLEGIRSSPLPDVAEHIYSTKENKEIMEKVKTDGIVGDHVASSMVYHSENDIGPSSSVEVKPLMHYTI